MRLRSRRFVLAVLTLCASAQSALAADRVAVVRVGDGAAPLSNAAQAVFVEYFTEAGSADGTVTLPTASGPSGAPLTLSGTATSEGALRRSADKRYLTLAGYGAAPGTAAVASTTSAAVNRVVGRLSVDGAIDTTTALNSSYSANNIRGVVSDDGAQFFTTGTAAVSGGIQFVELGSSVGTQLTATPTNIRTVGIFDGQLYIGSSSGAFVGVSAVGTGVPTTAGQTTTLLPGFAGAGSAYAFAFFDVDPGVAGVDTLYVADDRNVASGGGIQKWTLGGGTWTLGTTFAPGATSGARGITGRVVSGTTVKLYATTAETSANTLVSFVDDGTPSPVVTVLATAAANTIFRGVDLAPEELVAPPVPAAPPWGQAAAAAMLAGVALTVLARRRNLSPA